jgi:lipoprotein-anchoring transpeptidase ErfK/SrfK
MGLSRPHYGIHGTNRPSSIGKRVSKGCIRMYNRDVENLARYVGIGTPVIIR